MAGSACGWPGFAGAWPTSLLSRQRLYAFCTACLKTNIQNHKNKVLSVLTSVMSKPCIDRLPSLCNHAPNTRRTFFKNINVKFKYFFVILFQRQTESQKHKSTQCIINNKVNIKHKQQQLHLLLQSELHSKILNF